MNHTPEQTIILDHVSSTEGLTLISSVAGSGKTTMLTSIASAIPHTNGLYMAYNKAVATESQKKFPSTTKCMTTHSMAYRATVMPLKLKVGTFNYKSITQKMKYDNKVRLLDSIKAFCLSKYTSFSKFATDEQLPDFVTIYAPQYLGKMRTNQIECSHEFYLKLFHIMLASGDVTYDPFDFIMLDEAGDLNEVTLEIFKLLPSTRKIAVGDPFQNIYRFNYTINCFEVLKDEGTLFSMSKSFRVSDKIAPKIEAFCHKYLDPAMTFEGVPTDDNIQSRAYITRTNSMLISKMIELNNTGTPYGLVRKASEIFRVPLILLNLKYQGFIKDSGYKHLQADVDDWYEDASLRSRYKTALVYLADIHREDIQLAQAFKLVLRFGKIAIMTAYSEARNHEQSKQSYLLMTAHSSKGLEVDEVSIGFDLNSSIEETIDKIKAVPNYEPDEDEKESLNLYYVAVTRAAKRLIGATHI